MTTLEDLAAFLRPDLSLGQRIVCRLIDGLPPKDQAQAGLYRTLLHRDWGDDLRQRRARVIVRAGRGASKSYIGAWFCMRASLAADVSGLAPGEIASVPIVAPEVRNARAAMNFVRGFVETIPTMRKEVVGPPLAESVTFRNGTMVELVAARRGGMSVRSKPIAGMLEDEANFFYDESTGVVNDRDITEAAEYRLLPGGQMLLISSSWVESGLFYSTYKAELGRCRDAMVIDVPHPQLLNPAWVAPEGVTPGTKAWLREVEGQWVQDDADSLAAREDVDACMEERSEEPLPRQNGVAYQDALDLSGTQHRTGYAIGHSEEGRVIVDGVWSWAPSVPVEDRMREIAKLRRTYHIRTDCAADQFSFAAAAALGRVIGGISMVRDTGNRVAQAEQASKLMQARMVSLPKSARLARQFPMLSIRNTSGGGQTLAMPARDLDGGHFDEAVAVMLLCARLAEDEAQMVRPIGWTPPKPPTPWEDSPW
jgi:hypothetical protein